MRNSERILVTVTEADVALAKGIVAWVKSLKESGAKMSDYLWNLYVTIEQGAINHRTANIAASAVVAYQKELARRAELGRPSVHVGVVGEKSVHTVKLLRVIPIEGNYGLTYLHGFEDEAGNSLVWFGSSQLRYGEEKGFNPVAVGETVTIEGKVKEHGSYKGRAQTGLTRVKLYVPKAPKVRKPRAKKEKKAEEAPAA